MSKRAAPRWAILVVWEDGSEEYLKEGLSDIATMFFSRADAVEQTKFMRVGMEGDCQSINIVPYPKGGKL